VAFLDASETLNYTTFESIHNQLDWSTVNAFFSYFDLTGIPARGAPTIFRSPPLMPWRVTKIKRPNEFSRCFNAASFVVAITQRRNLARVARLSERDAEIWSSLMSTYFLQHTMALLTKAKRGQISAEERKSLGFAFLALLFALEVRSTSGLEAAQRNFDELCSAGNKPLFNASLIMCDYVLRSPDHKKDLRVWARHWLRKLYGCKGFYKMLEPAAMYGTILFCMDLEVDLQCTSEDESMEDKVEGEIEEDKSGEDKINDAAEEDEVDDDEIHDDETEDDEVEGNDLAPSPILMISYVLPRAVEECIGGSKTQEL